MNRVGVIKRVIAERHGRHIGGDGRQPECAPHGKGALWFIPSVRITARLPDAVSGHSSRAQGTMVREPFTSCP